MYLDLFFQTINYLRKDNLWLMFPVSAVFCLIFYYLIPYTPLSLLVPDFFVKHSLDNALAYCIMSIGFMGLDLLMSPRLGNIWPVPQLFILMCVVSALLIEVVTLGGSIF